jgi:hypothetical protein
LALLRGLNARAILVSFHQIIHSLDLSQWVCVTRVDRS